MAKRCSMTRTTSTDRTDQQIESIESTTRVLRFIDRANTASRNKNSNCAAPDTTSRLAPRSSRRVHSAPYFAQVPNQMNRAGCRRRFSEGG
eukprot:158389-Alexandrium_andersonii.AAC.1